MAKGTYSTVTRVSTWPGGRLNLWKDSRVRSSKDGQAREVLYRTKPIL